MSEDTDNFSEEASHAKTWGQNTLTSRRSTKPCGRKVLALSSNSMKANVSKDRIAEEGGDEIRSWQGR